ncbi:hypothetical protein FB451DRAFT_1391072 [Mycena latifolia]|nr:hypothetical protein FB451DRAFT_1391072 [Mycena latifolia]
MASPSPFPPTPAELEELLLLVQDGRATSYLAVAALALLIYDHILSLDHEVQCAPPPCLFSSDTPQDRIRMEQRKSFGGYLYLWFMSISSTLTVATIDIILIMSLDSLRKVAPLVVHFGIIDVGGDLFTIVVFITRSVPFVHIGTPIELYFRDVMQRVGAASNGQYLPHPLFSGAPKYLTFYAVPSLVVTSVMFVMTVYNCTTRLGLGLNFSSRNTMPLIHLFLRDGIFWFLAVVAVNPPQLIVWAVGRPTLGELLVIPAVVVYSIIGSRVLLNITEIMTHGVANREIITA